MTRVRDRKTGTVTDNSANAAVIADGGLFVAEYAGLTQRRLHDILSQSNILLDVTGVYEYCDELGTYSCRQFDAYYNGDPDRQFRLISDRECWKPLYAFPKSDSKIEYLPPCATTKEIQEEHQTHQGIPPATSSKK
jgi:hypothetical protein